MKKTLNYDGQLFTVKRKIIMATGERKDYQDFKKMYQLGSKLEGAGK